MADDGLQRQVKITGPSIHDKTKFRRPSTALEVSFFTSGSKAKCIILRTLTIWARTCSHWYFCAGNTTVSNSMQTHKGTVNTGKATGCWIETGTCICVCVWISIYCSLYPYCTNLDRDVFSSVLTLTILQNLHTQELWPVTRFTCTGIRLWRSPQNYYYWIPVFDILHDNLWNCIFFHIDITSIVCVFWIALYFWAVLLEQEP